MVQQTISFSSNCRQLRNTSNNDHTWNSAQHLFYFCICITLFSSLIVYPSCANPIPAENDSSLMKVSQMSFSEKLSNPCSLTDASRMQRANLTPESRESKRRIAINDLRAKASLLKTNAETILNTNVLSSCSILDLPTLTIIPSAAEVSDLTALGVLRRYYTALMNHTAYMFFMTEPVSQNDRCNDDPDLSSKARSLASEMQGLMCTLRLCTVMLQQENDDDDTFEDSTEQILNEQLDDQPDCSKRSLRDCQTVDSTVTLLQELSNYLESTILDETSES